MITPKMLDPFMLPEHLGFIPMFLSEDDPRPARQQLDANYQHGGGWRPLKGWKYDPATRKIHYPGDPPLKPLAEMRLRDEVILYYPYSWVCIVHPDCSYEVARMD